MEPLGDSPAPILKGAATLPPMRPSKQVQATPTGGRRVASNAGKKQTGDRFAVLNTFVDCTQAKLTGLEVKVWLTMYRDTRHGTVSTAQADIAKRAGATLRGVQKALASLIKKGLVVLLVQGGLNRGPSRYRISPLANPSS
jgi:hypothetical protein